MTTKSSPHHRQRDLFETNGPPIHWQAFAPTVQKDILKQLREMLQSVPAQKLLKARKEGGHE
jgi:hypothetical protein